jgi:glycosyltransferase involved in cell wall biosynthesis
MHHAVLMDIPLFISNNEECKKICSEADIIVIQEYNISLVLQTALYWKAQKKKLVYDLDEAIDLIPEEMERYRFWRKGEIPSNFFVFGDQNKLIEPPPIQQLSWALTHMDAITVPSQRLVGDWERYGRVVEVQDYIDFDRYLSTKTHPKDEVWIGLGGDATPYQTFEQSGLLGALEEICRQRPQIRLFLGNISNELTDRMDIPNHQKITYSWLPPEDWVYYLANLEIGLAPTMSEYDFRSSRNRALEYLALKIPWIATDHLPYRDLKEFGMLVDNTKEAWKQGLLTVIDSLNYYQNKAGETPYLFALSQEIDENIGKILDVYESILKG